MHRHDAACQHHLPRTVPHVNAKRIGVRQRAHAWLLTRVRELVIEAIETAQKARERGEYRTAWIRRQELAMRLNIPDDKAGVALYQLSREGLIGQPIEHHTKNPGWIAETYPLILDERI